MSDMVRRLRHVLAGQRFPAERWEIITCAELYGADTQTRRDLQALPAVRYQGIGDVLLAVERARAVGGAR